MISYSLFLLMSLMVLLAVMLVWAFRMCVKRGYYQQHIHSLEGVLIASGGGVLIFDADGQFRYSNETAQDCCKSLGGQDLFHNLDEFISYIFDYATSDQFFLKGYGGAFDFREVVEDDNGRSYLVEMCKQENQYTSAIIRDVSFLKEREHDFLMLNKVNEKLNLAIESSSCGIFILDAKREGYPVTFANRFCRTLSCDDVSESLSFCSFLKKFGETDQEKKIHAAIEGCKTFQKHICFGFEDTKRWFDFRITPVFDAEGQVNLYVGVMGEVTELKNKEIEINRAQKLDSLGQLSAGIAHDFNNILSIIEGYARMIAMNTNNTERVEEYAQKITEASARGAGLTKKMMAFAQHKVKQDYITDLRVLMDEQEVLLKPLIDESIDFKVVLGDGDLFGCCEPDSFVQILMNLVVNARDAMSSGGRLRVYIERIDQDKLPIFVKDCEQSYLRLRVRDNGMGMRKEICERIFDPFFTSKEQGQGTGLGLSVTYGLVRDMGGYIDVRSELSVGSEFSVYIPRSDELPEQFKAQSLKKIDAGGVDFTGFTALVVEDEPDLRLILSETLEQQNMNVIFAENGHDALVLQDDHVGNIDVLITDLVMPGINGLKLAEMMKALHPDIETVFMSGYPARGEQAKVVIPDDAIFMPKPLDYVSLSQCLFNVLKQQTSNVVPISHQNVGEI